MTTSEQLRPPACPMTSMGAWRAHRLADVAVVRRALARAGAPEIPQRLVLVASELLTNALRHGAPPVVCRVYRLGEGWLLDVADGEPKFHSPAGRDPEVGGYGLAVIRRASRAWGWYRADDDDGVGKHVWAWLDG